MKKTIYILVFAVLAAIWIGCGKDEENNGKNKITENYITTVVATPSNDKPSFAYYLNNKIFIGSGGTIEISDGNKVYKEVFFCNDKSLSQYLSRLVYWKLYNVPKAGLYTHIIKFYDMENYELCYPYIGAKIENSKEFIESMCIRNGDGDEEYIINFTWNKI